MVSPLRDFKKHTATLSEGGRESAAVAN